MKEIKLKNGEVWTHDQIRSFFAGIRAAIKTEEPCPIGFNTIWPMAYGRKSDAKKALLRLGLKDGSDYHISVRRLPQGDKEEEIWLSVKAVEHLIARKLPEVFEVYRKVFHEWFKDHEDWNKERSDGKVARKTYTAICKSHGVHSWGYGLATNAIYLGVFGKDANEMKKVMGLPKNASLRDHLDEIQLCATRLAELCSGQKIEIEGPRGNHPVAKVARKTSDEIGTAMGRMQIEAK